VGLNREVERVGGAGVGADMGAGDGIGEVEEEA